MMPLVTLLAVDAVFVGICLLVLIPLSKLRRASVAVAKRNFIGYYSNPTGYVFLCLFVLLTSFAAFWPHEFFRANLANLNQLNQYLPYIMLIFVPAITMGLWAEERRQGTDELLLTLPAEDLDIVLGKFLAAAGVFTTSLLFSQLCNFLILLLVSLGDLDTGLLLATYFGYWMVGIGMLAIGMVASFLTSNLTVGFILGAAFNAPLVFATHSDVIIPWNDWARFVSRWSVDAQLDDYTRGVVSLSSTVYFLMVMVVGLYLSLVLIGRRHWSGGKDGTPLIGHFLGRTLSLVVITVAITSIFTLYDWRPDVTEGRVSSLSPDTLEILDNLDPEHTIEVHAFLSADVPEAYVKTRYDLISMLKEFRSKAGDKVRVIIEDDLEPFSEEAVLAQERFGIVPQPVRTRTRGAIQDEEILLGAVFTSGVEKVVVPFFDYGIPVEYELIRSINTVAKKARKTVGVVQTDARLFGGFDFSGGRPRQIPRHALIEELEKQYDVEEVDPAAPIATDKYDVLLIVQPSSLGPAPLHNVVEAVRAGVPAAIFEDPYPRFMGNVPGTGVPRQAAGSMFNQQPQPKGNIRELWTLLGLEVPGRPSPNGTINPHIAWQRYNPYPKLQIRGIPDEWVFASVDAPGGAASLSPADEITSGLTQIFFPVPGVIERAAGAEHLDFIKLVTTGDVAGTIRFDEFVENQGNPYALEAKRGRPKGEQILAARIQGEPKASAADSDRLNVAAEEESEDGDGTGDSEAGDSQEKPRMDVIYVTDIDLMVSEFMRLRARPEEDPEQINWKFENVTFLLNVIDALSKDDEYISIRKRKPRHSTLQMVEARTQVLRQEELEKQMEFQLEKAKAETEAEEEAKRATKQFVDAVNDLRQRQMKGEDIDPARIQEAATKMQIQQELAARREAVKKERAEREMTRRLESIRREYDLRILAIQNEYKFWAVVIPPIAPLCIGLFVFVRRRLREREGISKTRLV